MVASLGIEFRKSGKEIIVEKMEAKSKHYLERMGLFELMGIDSGIKITAHESTGRFIPLKIIKNSRELNQFITEMIPILHLDPHQALPIRYIISELVRNVFEHSNSNIGAVVCAQFYEESNVIRIGIADRGIGISKSISKSYKVEDDLEGIKYALAPGITGTTRMIGGSPANAGMGLFFVKSIAKINKDFFIIYSGNAMYKLLRNTKIINHVRLYTDPFRDKHSKNNNYPYWQGTVVGIDITLDRNKDFDTLLDLISKVYQKELKYKKKSFFKRPQFA